jgi:hypothetical protein
MFERHGQTEVVALICWLVSDECSFSTGATYDIFGVGPSTEISRRPGQVQHLPAHSIEVDAPALIAAARYQPPCQP